MKLNINFQILKRGPYWKRNLRGVLVTDGKELSDAEVRKVAEYAISHNKPTLEDLSDEDIADALK